VVQTFDQGVMVDGTPYIVMELLEGMTLQEMLDRDKRLQLMRASSVVGQVARALTKAHDLGIVHRDIKPDNIFVTPTDEGVFAKVLDFGIAKQTQLPKVGGLTNPGVMVGTPEYMSPEQVLSARDVDYRADLWALAITAYYMLTGELPFTAEALGTLCVKLLDGSFTPPSKLRPDLHAGFDAFFEKALAHAPSDRFQSARELSSAFVHLCAGTTGSIADDTSSGFTPFPGSLVEMVGPSSVPSSRLPLASSPAVPTTTQESSGTLTGSSANRRHEGERRGRRVGAAVFGGIALVAIGVAIFVVRMSSDEAPAGRPLADPQAEVAQPEAQPERPAPVAAEPSSPTAMAEPEPAASAAPEDAKSAEPTPATDAKGPRPVSQQHGAAPVSPPPQPSAPRPAGSQKGTWVGF
jgi:serine/threonine protein kinase